MFLDTGTLLAVLLAPLVKQVLAPTFSLQLPLGAYINLLLKMAVNTLTC